MKISEEKFIRFLCVALRVLAWIFLAYGALVSIVSATAVGMMFLVSRWSGVVVLAFFIFIFLLINLATKVTEVILKIKTKVQA